MSTPASTAVVLAHGVGGRQDLPIPFSFALVGVVAALVVSFAGLAWLWRTPRLHGQAAGRPLPGQVQKLVDSPVLRGLLRAVGLAVTAFVAVAAIAGPDDQDNPTAGFVYVLFWVGLVPVSVLFGPVWRLLNPVRTLHLGLAALFRIPAHQGLWRYPVRLGYWPAAAGLFAFTWLELVAPGRTSTVTLVLWFGGYGAVQLLGAVAFGSTWFARGDGFEVYSSLLARLAPFGRRQDGALVVRNPFNGLDALRPAPGLVSVVCVLLGSTAYDGFTSAPVWITTLQSGPLPAVVSGTLGLTVAVLLAAGLFGTAVRAAGALAGEPGRGLPAAFAHSVIPIAVGYLIAHYFSLLLFEGQRTLIQASDPLGTGADLFGTAGRQVDFAVLTATAIASLQVLAIVIGHVFGVIAAHDRAVRLFPVRRAVVGQLPLLALMIIYTLGGLTLLFAA